MSQFLGNQTSPAHLTCAWNIQTPYSTIPGIRSRRLTRNDMTWQPKCYDVVSGIRYPEHHKMPNRRDIPLSSPSCLLVSRSALSRSAATVAIADSKKDGINDDDDADAHPGGGYS
ncbi:uncharacterized protein TrAtP1_010467 [Trichoderma atroviride]|uniref:uncharacterized protein n=1 Tax=Hypocrea atroviridis TaxID=63577 RepID=UPI00332DBA75|nr:hypothetical protein TrAtP1_010467 [Trichoderma atroviride]